MIKQLINKNQALTIYLLLTLLLFAYPLALFLIKIFSAEGFTCQTRGFGSGAREECDAITYAFSNIFWVALPIIVAQIILIPSAIISYFSSKFIQKNIKSKYKEQLWFKYILTIFFFAISIVIAIKIIGSIDF